MTERVAVDARSLAIFRIGLGSLLLANLLLRAPDLEAHYTDLGVLPRAALRGFRVAGVDPWSLHAASGGLAWQIGLSVLSACFATALLLGWRTRLATGASWLLLVSLQHRNPLVLTGGDVVLRLLLFWSLFLPLGAVWSLDARRPSGPVPRPSSEQGGGWPEIRSLASGMLLMQVAIIYPIAALFKWREPVWRELEAFASAMSIDGVATDLGRQLSQLAPLAKLATASILIFEALGVLILLLVWRRVRLRSWVVFAFMAFHLVGIGLTMRIGLFPVVMAVAWIPFLPAACWQWPARSRACPESRARAASRDAQVASSTPARSRVAPALLPPARQSLWVGAFGIVMLAQNAATLGWIPGDATGPRGVVGTLARVLALDQHWSLWSRPPSNRYFVIASETSAGEWIDLHREGRPLDWERPARQSRNSRWWKLELSLSRPEFADYRAGYGRYLLRAWNRSAPRARHVERAEGWLLEGERAIVEAGQARRTRLWQVASETAERTHSPSALGGTRSSVSPASRLGEGGRPGG